MGVAQSSRRPVNGQFRAQKRSPGAAGAAQTGLPHERPRIHPYRAACRSRHRIGAAGAGGAGFHPPEGAGSAAVGVGADHGGPAPRPPAGAGAGAKRYGVSEQRWAAVRVRRGSMVAVRECCRGNGLSPRRRRGTTAAMDIAGRGTGIGNTGVCRVPGTAGRGGNGDVRVPASGRARRGPERGCQSHRTTTARGRELVCRRCTEAGCALYVPSGIHQQALTVSPDAPRSPVSSRVRVPHLSFS